MPVIPPPPPTSPQPDGRSAVRPSVLQLPVSRIAEVSALGFGDPDIVTLWYGEGDLSTPDFICDAATAALKRGETFYTYKRGLPQLRQAVAHYLTDLYARPTAMDRITVTSSGMNAIMLACQAILDAGDNLAAVSPVWPNVAGAVGALGAEVRAVHLTPRQDGGWSFDLDRVIAACDARTRAVFVNSPGNPTGWVMPQRDAEDLLAFTRSRGLWLIADEVYARIVYEGRAAPSFHDLTEPEDRVIVINSFSKSWAMTGWRLGWMAAPEELTPAIDKLVEYNTSGAPAFLQEGALTAVTEGEPLVARIVEQCRQGRDILVDGLQRFPRITLARPEGAFYAFCRVDGMADSLSFAKDILHRCKVGVAPGSAFGEAGEGYLRLCFASSADKLRLALDRLTPALK